MYADLIKQGYFLTSGSKFGGDFLVYPGKSIPYNRRLKRALAFHKQGGGLPQSPPPFPPPNQGDPYRYHSHFVARVMSHEADFTPLDLVSAGRLGQSHGCLMLTASHYEPLPLNRSICLPTTGTVVKKAPLLCTVDAQDGVHYLSVEWTGTN